MSVCANLPASVRYVKNGAGGKWWARAKNEAQVHAGWDGYPEEMIMSRDLEGLKIVHGDAATQDYNALSTLLNGKDHIWVTVQDGFLWWCTVTDQIGIDSEGSTEEHGHFWLICDRPWSNRSLSGDLLAIGELPGAVAQIAAFRATVCKPSSHYTIRRLIIGEQDHDVIIAKNAKKAFIEAVESLVRRLHEKDFELLIDLILQRTGWARTARLGGATEGVDIEAENAATGEIAFVQIKSRATENLLNSYISKFEARRERYSRIIFAVHSPQFETYANTDRVHVWDGRRVAELIVTLGLSDWLSRRI